MTTTANRNTTTRDSSERAAIVALNSLLTKLMAGPLTSANANVRIGTSSKKTLKNTACTVVVMGVPVSVAAAETAFTATTHDIADGKNATFLLATDGAGVLTITKAADQTPPTVLAPVLAAGKVAIGSVLIAPTGQIFDASTDDLDAAWLSVTYTDLTQVIPSFVGDITGTAITSAT